MHPSPLLSTGLAARANAVASLIRERLDSPASADAHAAHAVGQSDVSFWNGASLSEGHAGLALLHLHAAHTAERGEEGKRSRDRAFSFVRAAFAATQENALTHPGLFDGTAGLAFVLRAVSDDEPRFLPSLAALDEQLSRQVLAMELPRHPGVVADHHYDLVYGCAGILAHLCHVRPASPLVEQALQRCLRYLLWVGADRRWAVEGRLDTGMSHGAAGIAAALATAWRHGHRLPGQRLVLDQLVAWLLEVGSSGGRQLQWPRSVPATPHLDAGDEAVPAWCHGTGGVAAGLLTVAGATGDRALETRAFAALDGLLDRVAAGDVPRSPTVCHGLAGLVALAYEFAVRGSEGAARGLAWLVADLLDAAEPEQALVYRDRETTGHIVDNPGLLTGAAGVALTLRAIATGHRPSWWQVLFLR
ncbi:lanthionine synthetase LanC family protein [Streptomyces sp. CT34]|uniref:lanthionine synthetase LanC family protein n=1 Tax=Streptomyces sp. CT34 TaxID=1553907 RepID=UPI0006909190|nr:lanthionine synthetase LanC family protein [Streptomyces sp. CT34]